MREAKRSSLIRHSLLSGVILATSGALAAVNPSSEITLKASATDGAKSAENYGKLPLAFEANHGQSDPSVKFLSRGSGYSLFLTDSEAVLALGIADCKMSADPHGSKPGACVVPQDSVRMRLDGALAGYAAKATGDAELPGKVNYFVGNDPAKWHSDLPTYAKVRVSHMYRGIDLVYYGRQSQLEYDFVVAPGANTAAIRLHFDGQKSLRIAANGNLVLAGERGSATFHKPVVYQERDGRRQPVAGSFRLIAKNTVGFALGGYDHAQTLVIDPVLVYSTYLGGSGSNGSGDQGNGIAVDSSGNAYIVGTTYSSNFPVTTEPFQAQNTAALAGHGSTVFVTKLNATGTALLYSTYLGGSGSGSGGDFGYGIALDPVGNAYVTGATYSTNFPITCGAFQTTNDSTATGATTAFVTKLDTNGSRLLYSTYLGGKGNQATPPHGDVAQAIAVNTAGNAYVTGYTYSSNFPTTAKVLQTEFHGSATVSNAFVTELNLTGTATVYSTYLGGSGSNGTGDYGNSIALDTSGDAYVAGNTASANFPVTGGALQTALGGSSNAFVTELNPTGTDQVYSTYLGGNGADSAQAIVVDSKGFAYVAGNATSTNFPVTDGVLEGVSVANNLYFSSSLGGYGPAGFVAKLNQEGSAPVYSTYLEGPGTSVTGLAVDNTGTAYIAGSAFTALAGNFTGFQATPDTLPSDPYTGSAAFLVKLDPSAAVLNYATLFGGEAHDGIVALALDSTGNVYLTGNANSSDFPTTTGVYQTVNNAAKAGGSNAFIGKLALAAEANQTTYPDPPTPPIPMTVSIITETIGGNCYESGWEAEVELAFYTGVAGPPPTNVVEFYGDFQVGYNQPVPGAWGGTSTIYLSGDTANGYPPPQSNWTAAVQDDSNYQGSYIGGVATGGPICDPSQASVTRPVLSGSASQTQLRMSTVRDNGSSKLALNSTPVNPAQAGPVQVSPTRVSSTPAKPSAPGAKFIPPLAIPSTAERAETAEQQAQSQSSFACIAPLTLLTVTVGNQSRYYGAANPNFTYSIVGLLDGDTIAVTPSTIATVRSPVGAYPVTATASGVALENYTLTMTSGMLHVLPATLRILAVDESVTYGQTPAQPTAYKLAGFVPGDTASVVSGAPVLSTTVTSATPPGFYKIGISVGTLRAANYIFTGIARGEEAGVYVEKAPLTLTANSLTMTHGGPVPTLTYKLTGFVNGQSATGTVTGTPTLSTTATSSSAPGQYPITISAGTLAAANYSFQTVNGVLTVMP